jgi:hypothetical protein
VSESYLTTLSIAEIRMYCVGDRWISPQHWWNDTNRRKLKYLKERSTCTRAILSTKSPTWPGPERWEVSEWTTEKQATPTQRTASVSAHRDTPTQRTASVSAHRDTKMQSVHDNLHLGNIRTSYGAKQYASETAYSIHFECVNRLCHVSMYSVYGVWC